MKIITKCIIDMRDFSVLEESSFEYEGEIAECKGGGGGGSGAVSYPPYLEDVHKELLDQNGTDTITSSMIDAMNTALGNSPWVGATAYDPDGDLLVATNAADNLQSLVDLMSSNNNLDSIIANVLDKSRITESIDAYADDLDARLKSEVIPRFERGMQDINAVMSSAFAIGRALIEQGHERQIAKFSADLNMRAFSDDALRVINLKLEYQRIATQMLAEVRRIKIVAKNEEISDNIKYDQEDAVWDLDVFQRGANMIAGIGGGVVNTRAKGPSKLQSALGGTLSGGAAGAMIAGASGGAIAGPIGIAAGAALGLASAFL